MGVPGTVTNGCALVGDTGHLALSVATWRLLSGHETEGLGPFLEKLRTAEGAEPFNNSDPFSLLVVGNPNNSPWSLSADQVLNKCLSFSIFSKGQRNQKCFSPSLLLDDMDFTSMDSFLLFLCRMEWSSGVYQKQEGG